MLKKIIEDYGVIKIVDVGAMEIENDKIPYSSLSSEYKCTITGFEPDKQECDKLNKNGNKTIPAYVGDGTEKTFNHCNFNMTSSFFEPNTPLLNGFNNLENLTRVVSREKVQTVRLDDVISDADYLKIDVQGAEVDVFSGADRLLNEITVVHTEVCFVPLYKEQPLFAEIDQSLRKKGFLFHKFGNFCGRTLKPLLVGDNPNRSLSQVLWVDAIYIRDFTRFNELSAEKLLKLAIILDEAYKSYDFAYLALAYYDRKTGSELSKKYQTLLLEK